MKCPNCASDSEVLSTRTLPRSNTVTRRRRCLGEKCGFRFTTRECVAPSENGQVCSLGSSQQAERPHALPVVVHAENRNAVA
jgi:transcriptional regulator NrdR family protein